MLKIKINKKLHGSSGEMDLDIKLNIKQGDFISLTGFSGSGKTTLLRILAGLESANGTLSFNDEKWLDYNFNLVPQKRRIGFVFQNYALFPNMSVEENLLFVKNDKKLASYLLSVTELTKLKNRVPNTLSGGQQQRVSLCRALMNRPKLLLMDEPLSALDPTMRLKLQNEILILHKEFNTTTIMVSHDLNEIYKLSNRIIRLEYGKIISDEKAIEVVLKTKKSSNLSFEDEILNLIKEKMENFNIGDIVDINIKAFRST